MRPRLLPAIFVLLLAVANFAQVPQVVVQTGHSGLVQAVAYSPDGRVLASGDATGVVKFWDLSTDKEFRDVRLPAAVVDLGFSADGKTVYAADTDGAVSSIEVLTGNTRELLPRDDTLPLASSVINGPKGQVAQIMQNTRVIRVSSLTDGKAIFTYRLPDSQLDKMPGPPQPSGARIFDYFGGDFVKLAYDRGGTVLAASTGEHIVLIDAGTGAAKRVIRFPDQGVRESFCLAVSDDGRSVADCERSPAKGRTPAARGFIAVRSIETGQILRKIDIPMGKVVRIKYGKVLVGVNQTADYTYVIRRWDPHTGAEIGAARVEDDGGSLWEYDGLAIGPDGKTMALGGGDISTGRVHIRNTLSGDEYARMGEASSPVMALRYLKGDRLLTSDRLWDLKTGKLVRSGFYRNSYSSDGSLFVDDRSGPDDPLGELVLRDAVSGRAIHKFDRDKFDPLGTQIDLAPGGRFLLAHTAAARDIRGQAVLIDGAAYEPVFTFPDNASVVSFSPNGKLIAYLVTVDEMAGKYAIKVWDIDTQKLISTIDMLQPAHAMAFDPDGDLLAVAGGTSAAMPVGVVGVYDAHTGDAVHQLLLGAMTNIVAFSPDGKTLAAGAGERVVLIDRGTWTQQLVLTGHSSWVESLTFSPDGKRVISGGWEGQIIFWDRESGRLIERLLSVGDDDYLFVSPDNYYMASRKGAAEAIAFRQGMRALPFEQFDIRYNRPDLALAPLGTALPATLELYHQAYLKRLRQNHLTEQSVRASLAPPEVYINDTAVPAATNQKLVHLRVKAVGSANDLARLNVYVNDVALYGEKGQSLGDAPGKTVLANVDVELTSGRNRIQVSAVDTQGIESVRRTVNVRYDGPSPNPDLYLVAIGVSQYQDTAYNLTYPASDADNIVKLFEKRAVEKEHVLYLGGVPKSEIGSDEQQKKSFYRVHKLELKDADATLEKIAGLREFLAPARPEDEVVVFISGHGLLDKGNNYYFATHDIDFHHPEARGLSFDALSALLDNTRSRRKVLLLDTCHAGELDPAEVPGPIAADPGVKGIDIRARTNIVHPLTGVRAPDDVASELFADLRLGSGTIVISASGGLQYAYESPEWAGGVFTYAIRLGLEQMQADTTKDPGRISVAELRNFVSKKVVELTDGRQRPNTRTESIEFDFRVY